MKTKKENLKDNKVKITVDFTKDEINEAISKKYKELAAKYKFPGFRKGKAPRPVIDSAFGAEGVIAQVTDDLVNDTYPLTIDEANLFPVGKGDFGKEAAKLVEQGKPYQYSYTIEVEPTYELTNNNKVVVEMPKTEATKEEIDAQIEQFRQTYFEYVDAKASEKAGKDSTVSLKIKAFDDDKKAIDSLTNDSLNYHLGSKFLPEEFEKKIVGTKKGDSIKFKMKMPKEPTVYTTSLTDKTKNIDFDIVVNSIQKKKFAEIDDE